jgi:beta-glucosidase
MTSKSGNPQLKELLARLTLEEKCSLLLSDSPAIERLGIPAYHWWNECLHGVSRAGRATVFPQAIGLAAAFDPDLIERIGQVVAEEGRAKYNAAVSHGLRGQYRGLTFWSPNVNIFRDPRWGRGQETYGEDPFLSGTLGAALVRGIQQESDGRLKAAACAKHYAVHSGPEGLRHVFDAVVSPKDLHETYLPAFKMLVDEGVEAVMGAYNRTNGEPCCASHLLIEDILRDRWGFRGHFVSDCGALGDIHDHHKITSSAEESAALAVKRGCDLNCGSTYEALPRAVALGLVTEEQIDVSVQRLLDIRQRLGTLGPQAGNQEGQGPYSGIGLDRIRAPEHVSLALEAAEKSIVLLKNNGVLPIHRGDTPKKIYLTGHNAASVDVLLGNYFGVSDSLVTVVEGVVAAAPEHFRVEYRLGMQADRENANTVDWSIPGKWDSFDAIVAVVGLVPALEGEEGEAILSPERGDRTDICLPKNQVDRIRKLKATGIPLVVVFAGGSAVAIPEIHDIADAVLCMWYPGEQGGTAVAKILFGEVSPSGKLPITFPRAVEQLPPFDDYSMDGRTYRFMRDDPLYPFGFGLSYTSFAYADARVSEATVTNGESVTVTASVTNTGTVAAHETVQCYISDLEGTVRTPISSLCGVSTVYLTPGSATEVSFQIEPEVMQLVLDDGTASVEPGTFRVSIGSCSPGDRGIQLGAAQPVVAEFVVVE